MRALGHVQHERVVEQRSVLFGDRIQQVEYARYMLGLDNVARHHRLVAGRVQRDRDVLDVCPTEGE